MKQLFLLLICCMFYNVGSAQVKLKNPSFEGQPQDATTPVNWHPCEPGTTPDILPGPWNVYTEPSDGNTFVGMISRSDGTFESIGQRVSKPMRKGACYAFSVDLAHSKTYDSYNKPLKLRIYAASKKCGKMQLVGQTDFITHEDWEAYTFEFTPEETMFYLIFEAHYSDDDDFSYKGNLLLDNISEIKPCIRASLPILINRS